MYERIIYKDNNTTNGELGHENIAVEQFIHIIIEVIEMLKNRRMGIGSLLYPVLLTLIILSLASSSQASSTSMLAEVGGCSHTVTFIGMEPNFPNPGQSTWFYQVCSVGSPAVSHTVFSFGCWDDVVDAGTWTGSYTLNSCCWTKGYDPSTGTWGVKFEDGFENDCRYYYFTVDDVYSQGQISYTIKAGGQTCTGYVTGPSCVPVTTTTTTVPTTTTNTTVTTTAPTQAPPTTTTTTTTSQTTTTGTTTTGTATTTTATTATTTANTTFVVTTTTTPDDDTPTVPFFLLLGGGALALLIPILLFIILLYRWVAADEDTLRILRNEDSLEKLKRIVVPQKVWDILQGDKALMADLEDAGVKIKIQQVDVGSPVIKSLVKQVSLPILSAQAVEAARLKKLKYTWVKGKRLETKELLDAATAS